MLHATSTNSAMDLGTQPELGQNSAMLHASSKDSSIVLPHDVISIEEVDAHGLLNVDLEIEQGT
jgi:hypothetical protein